MDSIHTRINENTPTEKSVGVNLCFLHLKFRLSVGETCGLPRANTVRPYRALYNFSDKNISHWVQRFFAWCPPFWIYDLKAFTLIVGKTGLGVDDF